ncbi:MAG: glycosyltransferase family 2 protein [Patescibacteria group bacterium]
MEKMKIAIVIVSYNGLRCLPSALESCNNFAVQIPVYVIDNCSNDGSADYIEKNWPKVNLLRQDTNTGFAKGNNIGIRQAIADGAEAVFLLNQDAELTKGCLGQLTHLLIRDERVAAVQPRINLSDGRINSLGNCFHYLGFAYAGGNGLMFEEAMRRLSWFKKQEQPAYVSGAGVLLRVKALNNVGLFDEYFFMYHEDFELCLRLRSAGWRLEVLLEAQVIHHYKFAASINNYYYMERNRWLIWFLYFRPITLGLLILPLILSEVAVLFTSLVSGWFPANIRVLNWLFKINTWKYISSKRKEIAQIKTVSDKYLLSYASSTIHFQEKNPWYVRYIFNPLSSLIWFIIKPLILW